ncbi:MAG TPA: SET domain-containing protein-lysine N-methyltransferase [Flavobacteriales bacterium]|nr:SET domain-containing protein-lysine N-methyltransferase [Flavobacteriales bacterium]HRN36922.1 SET domain-containing protein-lysine N-methyltransferase [Flavobacteriales bacterium]HRO39208.1 SET domain-containing protein-lysine N-methyltransferase [Flavobacteriales bacterium]HRP81709.1 SET domain-containing protein-lysine N-methyltransferase [Flavobacteriales bacterium]HRQ85648.1 SET domain-containing protein-lysine N-methyltransferase [Flavobacteriales bacterium]
MARKILVRRSPVHGNGVFAAVDLPAGTELIEYKGRLITPKQADNWYPDEMETGHTFLFTLNDQWIIDANVGGNSARWINHSCAPNCIPYLHEHPTDRRKDRVIIETLRDVQAGEELCYDYGISFEVRHTARLKKIWACRCGAPNCTGTLLKPADHERNTVG